MFSRPPVKIVHTREARNVSLFARFLSKQKKVVEIKIAEDRYEGDLKLYLTENGADLCYKGGQPVMEKGLENHALISLFTKEGWCGNVFLPKENHVGSDFEETCAGSITLSKLTDIEDSAVRSLASKAFQKVDAQVRNPRSDNLSVQAFVGPGGALSLSREGGLWKNQREKV
jgi:hypothetical protein